MFYYEQHPLMIDSFSIQVCFPDFRIKGLNSSVSGRNRIEAMSSAERLLQSMVEYLIVRNRTVPSASEMEKVSLDRGINICEESPFRIEVENIIYEK